MNMSDSLYQAVFCGEVLDDHEPSQVREQLLDLGVLDGAKADQAFAGNPVTLRDGLTHEQALKYAQAVATAHANCRVVPESWVVCPTCRFPQEPADECAKCGLIFAKYREKELPELRTKFEIDSDLDEVGFVSRSEQFDSGD